METPKGGTEETGTRKATYVVSVDENRYKSQERISLTDKTYDKEPSTNGIVVRAGNAKTDGLYERGFEPRVGQNFRTWPRSEN